MEVEKSEESDLPRWRGFGVSSSIRDTPVVVLIQIYVAKDLLPAGHDFVPFGSDQRLKYIALLVVPTLTDWLAGRFFALCAAIFSSNTQLPQRTCPRSSSQARQVMVRHLLIHSSSNLDHY